MDYDKLIEQLRSYTYWLGQDGPESHDIHPLICDDAATAISTLQAENGKLRAELEQVKRERDAAMEYLRGQCRYCKHNLVCTSREGPHSNCWKWRGPKER